MLKLGNTKVLFNATFVGARRILGVEARLFVHHTTHGATLLGSCCHPPVATTPQGVGEKTEGDSQHEGDVLVGTDSLDEDDVQVVHQKHHEQQAEDHHLLKKMRFFDLHDDTPSTFSVLWFVS